MTQPAKKPGMGSVDSDATVIERSRRTPEAFAAIFDRHVGAVHGYLSRRAGRDGADGLVGEVFRVAFENRSRFRTDRESALPWLYGIAGNVLRQHRRGEHRRARLVTKLVAWGPDRAADREASDGVELAEALDEVVAVLDGLPEPEREAVLLYAWEDLSYEQIAVVQDVPVGTVRSRLNRARRRLRERVGGGGQEGGRTGTPDHWEVGT